MYNYLESATKYVEETIEKENIAIDDIWDYFETEASDYSGDFMEENISTEEAKKRVKPNYEYVYEAYMDIDDPSYAKIWKDLIEEQWCYLDKCARRYALTEAAEIVRFRMEKEYKEMQGFASDIIQCFESYLEQKAVKGEAFDTEIEYPDLNNLEDSIIKVLAKVPKSQQ